MRRFCPGPLMTRLLELIWLKFILSQHKESGPSLLVNSAAAHYGTSGSAPRGHRCIRRPLAVYFEQWQVEVTSLRGEGASPG